MTHAEKLKAARIFADLLFRGEIKLVYQIWGGKRIGIYIPKEKADDYRKN